MTKCVVVAGGNMGDVKARIEKAAILIDERIGHILGTSSFLRSESWGFSSDDFTNQAFVLSTGLSPGEVLVKLEQIEGELGRNKKKEILYKSVTGQSYAPREIDLDIILYGEERISSEKLRIPHPRATKRDFVLKTVSEALGINENELIKKIQTIENGKEDI